jgi:hypothetical protein
MQKWSSSLSKEARSRPTAGKYVATTLDTTSSYYTSLPLVSSSPSCHSSRLAVVVMAERELVIVYLPMVVSQTVANIANVSWITAMAALKGVATVHVSKCAAVTAGIRLRPMANSLTRARARLLLRT